MTEAWTPEQYKEYNKKGKANKYGAKPVVYDGHKYPSTKEANYAVMLDWKKKTGLIRGYKKQVPLKIEVNGQHMCKYIADFVVEENDGTITYIDTKGYRYGVVYDLFRLKKKLIFVTLGIDVVEV